jgi:hypothetical protein
MPPTYVVPLSVFLRITAGAEKLVDEGARAPVQTSGTSDTVADVTRHVAARLLLSHQAKLGSKRRLRLH